MIPTFDDNEAKIYDNESISDNTCEKLIIPTNIINYIPAVCDNTCLGDDLIIFEAEGSIGDTMISIPQLLCRNTDDTNISTLKANEIRTPPTLNNINDLFNYFGFPRTNNSSLLLICDKEECFFKACRLDINHYMLWSISSQTEKCSN